MTVWQSFTCVSLREVLGFGVILELEQHDVPQFAHVRVLFRWGFAPPATNTSAKTIENINPQASDCFIKRFSSC